MSVTKVTNYLIEPANNRARHPATMGSSWSCNMYREINQDVQYLESLPGLEFMSKVSPVRAACRGAYVSSVGLTAGAQKENLFVVYGNAVYRIDYAGNSEKIGTVAGGTRKVSFAETGGLNPYLLIADGTNLWAVNLLEGGGLRQITLPARITADGGAIQPSDVCCISGSVVINDRNTGFVYYSIPYPLNSDTRKVFDVQDGVVQYSEDNPLQVAEIEVDAFEYMFLDNYGTVQYFNAEASADNIMALASIGASLYLFGGKTVEIWQRGSGEYQTWQRQSYTANASNGIHAPASIAICGSNLYYLGSGESYAKGILEVSGQSYRKISPSWLDDKLLQETGDTAFGFAYAQGDHVFYVLQLTTLRQCWCYDTETGEWHQRTSRILESGEETRWRPSAMAWFRGEFLALCDDGCMYRHSDAYYWEDFGNHEKRLPMIRHRQGAVIVDEERPFIFNELAVECNVGTQEDYDMVPYLTLEVSKDGGNTWGHTRQASLGKTGQYSHRVRWHVLGYNRLCCLRLTFSHPMSLELTACSQRITPCTGVI